jgi:prepilin-type N-terminal cleavage/methylation domain-containing protein
MKNNKKIYSKGFTLIELLVVIAIIAILSTVVMAGLNSARAKGRDAKRLSDMKQLQSALELCFDNGVGYPSAASAGVIGTAGLLLTTNCAASSIPFSTYMNPLPTNPAPGGTAYTYCSEVTAGSCAAGNVSYRMQFTLEGTAGSLALGIHTATPSGIQ